MVTYEAKSRRMEARLEVEGDTQEGGGFNFQTPHSFYRMKVTFQAETQPGYPSSEISYVRCCENTAEFFYQLNRMEEGVEIALRHELFPNDWRGERNYLRCVLSLEEQLKKDLKKS